MNDQYYEVIVRNVSRADEDLLTSALFEIGASGVCEDLQFTQKEDTYDPITIEAPVFTLKAFFEQPPGNQELATSLSDFDGVEWVVATQQNKDWLAEWKKGFEAFELVDGIWVVPSWKEEPTEAVQSLFIDPGMAFGTGTHETTQIASQLIKDLKSDNDHVSSLLDVGTGSGILALLAEKIGFADIEATEIDSDALTVAKQNVEKNNCRSVRVLDIQVENIDRKYSVVMANIIDGILVQLQNDLKRCCDDDGFLILTGILLERKQTFLDKFSFEGFEIIKWIEKGEWTGLMAKRSNK